MSTERWLLLRVTRALQECLADLDAYGEETTDTVRLGLDAAERWFRDPTVGHGVALRAAYVDLFDYRQTEEPLTLAALLCGARYVASLYDTPAGARAAWHAAGHHAADQVQWYWRGRGARSEEAAHRVRLTLDDVWHLLYPPTFPPLSLLARGTP
jgi:hypothetical protein